MMAAMTYLTLSRVNSSPMLAMMTGQFIFSGSSTWMMLSRNFLSVASSQLTILALDTRVFEVLMKKGAGFKCGCFVKLVGEEDKDG